jgi:hypothetical protein
LAWSGALGLLRLVRLLTHRWRQAGIVGFRRPTKPRLKIGNPPFGRLKALPQRQGQGVLLGLAQGVKIRKLGHTLYLNPIDHDRIKQFPAISQNQVKLPSSYTG